MCGFTLKVASLRLVPGEPLFCIYTIPVDWSESQVNFSLLLACILECLKQTNQVVFLAVANDHLATQSRQNPEIVKIHVVFCF